MATIAFAANFSVWILYAVIGLELQQSLQLSATQLGFVFASPMLTGALTRIPLGILADRYNPKHIFTLQMLAVVPALLLLPYMHSSATFLWLGLWIGISGASFALVFAISATGSPECLRVRLWVYLALAMPVQRLP